jgi:predicted restriction endonuclease
MISWEEPKKRKTIGKSEWEVIKASHKNRCVICGKTEKQVGVLEKAHIRASSKGGSQVLPMCPTHHKMYDNDKLTTTQLKKIGLTKKTSARLSPRKKKKRDTGIFSW